MAEEKNIFTALQKNILHPSIKIVNYKVRLNGLPLNIF